MRHRCQAAALRYGRPAFAVGAEFFRREAAAVEFLRAFAHAEIVDRQHVGAAEREHEIHLDRPAPDAARGGEPLDDLVVAQARQRARFGDDAVDALLRDVLHRRDLLARETSAAQFFVRRRRGYLPDRDDPCPANSASTRPWIVDGGFAGKLLKHDGADQGAVGVVLALRTSSDRARAWPPRRRSACRLLRDAFPLRPSSHPSIRPHRAPDGFEREGQQDRRADDRVALERRKRRFRTCVVDALQHRPDQQRADEAQRDRNNEARAGDGRGGGPEAPAPAT